jgi:dUTP pyrophosphatase
METLKIKKLHHDAHVPTRAHDTDAGMDLYALPVKYTDKEKEEFKAVIGRSVTYAKFLDLFGCLGPFGDESISSEQKSAVDAVIKASESDLKTSLDEFFDKKIVVNPHSTVMVPTGIAVSIDPGYVGYVFARSGIASKQSLSPVNGVGVIDSAYRGEIKVPLHNHSDKRQIIDVGERIAQLVIQPISLCTPVEVKELDETDRGVGGFGSSGQK